jgi:hypothetical protein
MKSKFWDWAAIGIGAVIGLSLPSIAKCEDRVVIKDQYGKTTGSLTRDPVEKDRWIIRDEHERRIGTAKESNKK